MNEKKRKGAKNAKKKCETSVFYINYYYYIKIYVLFWLGYTRSRGSQN